MSKKQQIKAAAGYSGMSQAKIAAALHSTPSNFSQKLRRETFTDEELQSIAEAMGATYVPGYFVFPDGKKI